ncbi:urease accessory protein UreD [Robbsia andropogonis]|nr:urease accessory protein UreD [Robbsia andropogonis]MCP1119477.1 urease accessory protein UreD [Robbsia andropogonis]MCP1129460.1 urease accessory protein UreD [Robbsia andropogonis]
MLDAVSTALFSDRTDARIPGTDLCHARPLATGTDGAPTPATGWQARLTMRFATRATRATPENVAPSAPASYMAYCRHTGPLRIQKTLFPEGPRICHALIVHPPAGIAGGDTLRIGAELSPNSHAVLSTPGATKWYKANGRRASQHVTLRVETGARLDWLPQNNIVFDNARADMSVEVEVDADASVIGWDATLLGRQASGETWCDADIRAGVRLRRPDGTLLWAEQAVLSSDDPIRLAAQGLDGWSSFGTLWAVAPSARGATLHTHPALEDLRATLPFDDNLRAGVTCLPNGVVLIRVTARRMEALQQLLTTCWTALRPMIHNVPARPLRIWRT